MRRGVVSEQTKLRVRIAVSGVVLIPAIAIILGDYPEVPREWAFDVVLLLLGYWLR